MDQDDVRIDTYLTPRPESFWEWSVSGKEILWTGGAGKALAWTEELHLLLERMAGQGLPPLGAVLMVQAACQDEWTRGGRDRLSSYVRFLTEQRAKLGIRTPEGDDPLARIMVQTFDLVRSELDRVSRLPDAQRVPLRHRAAILEYIFEPVADRLPADVSLAVVARLARPRGPDLAHAFLTASVLEEFLRDCNAIRRGLTTFDEKKLALRLETGVDVAPMPAAIELPPAEKVRQILADLAKDPEMAGLATLTTRLMAALHVPRSLSDPEELPQGGISDLSNRGPLDRLLLSELAHDDLTLAVRIALNEALYTRRESPPRRPPERRLILLDSGIRMWGLPRLFATAVGLALAGTADRRSKLETFRAREAGLSSVDLTTKEGLVAHLASLEPAPHPGKAIPAFLELTDADHGGDAIVVTHADALTDPGLSSAFGDLPRDLTVAGLDGTGRVDLYTYSRRGRRWLGHAHVDLDVLNPAEVDEDRPLVRPELTGFPAIFGMSTFPLLLPAGVKLQRTVAHARFGAVTLTADGRFLHRSNSGRYWKQLSGAVPRGKVHYMHISDSGVATVLVGNNHGRIPLIRADLTANKFRCREISPSLAVPLAVCRAGGALLLVYRGRVEVFDADNGRRIDERTFADTRVFWVRDRFFRNAQHWYAAHFDGRSAKLQHIEKIPKGTLTLFDREGVDGPWAITDSGDVVSTADGQSLHLLSSHAPIGLVGISRSGHRLVVFTQTPPARQNHLLDLSRRIASPHRGDAGFALEPDVHEATRMSPNFSIRNQFKAIALTSDSSICLKSSTDWCLTIQAQERRLVLQQLDVAPEAAWVPFEFRPPPPGSRLRLRVAKFQDGSQAVLDSRGILHLVSSDGLLPEVSLILSDPLAAWMSDGRFHGPEPFIGDASSVPASLILDHLRNFARRLR